MARIRSVHPGLWTDEDFMDLSAFARLLIIGLWTEADDGGAFAWKPRQIKVRILGADDVRIEELLEELCQRGLVMRYSCAGSDYGAIRNFGKFQSPKKPSRKYPMPDEIREFSATSNIEPGTGSVKNEVKEEQVPNQFPTGSEPIPTGEEGKGGERKGDVGCNAHDAPTEKPIADRWQELAEDVIAATGNNPARSMVRADCVRQWLADASARGYSFETATEIILGTVREKSRFGGKGKPPAWFNSPVTQALASGTIPSAHIVGNAPKSRADRVADAWAGVPDIPGV
ncbi:putative phage-related protein [Acetobacter senegalensis DSM 18889]|nr:putative phage-related protein [Acetobacter senegalensis DSM 18889]